jgi:hypothetical protein
MSADLDEIHRARMIQLCGPFAGMGIGIIVGAFVAIRGTRAK